VRKAWIAHSSRRSPRRARPRRARLVIPAADEATPHQHDLVSRRDSKVQLVVGPGYDGERADLGDHGCRHHDLRWCHDEAARQELLVAPCRPQLPVPRLPASEAEQALGADPPVALVELDAVDRDQPDRGVRRRRADQRRHRLRLPEIVPVEKGEQRTPRPPDAGVPRRPAADDPGPPTALVGLPDVDDPIAVGGQARRRRIGRSVIDHDHLQRAVGLTERALQRLVDAPGLVEGRNDHADEWVHTDRSAGAASSAGSRRDRTIQPSTRPAIALMRPSHRAEVPSSGHATAEVRASAQHGPIRSEVLPREVGKVDLVLAPGPLGELGAPAPARHLLARRAPVNAEGGGDQAGSGHADERRGLERRAVAVDGDLPRPERFEVQIVEELVEVERDEVGLLPEP
jgi:hypothetical protein